MRVIFLIALMAGGCGVDRTLTVRSDPPEALLYLNGAEVGRTPFIHDFTWYGFYDVELRKEGYETLKVRGDVVAPWWQWVPLDLLAELSPVRLHDRQSLSYSLRATSEKAVDPESLRDRGEAMRRKLSSGR